MYTYRYPHPAVTTDCIVFGFDGVKLHALLVRRGNEPYKDCWALPGGFLNIDEEAADGARRELLEETGVSVSNIEQLGAYSQVDRDPRERVISIVYFTVARVSEAVGADDAAEARWFALSELPELAFDHAAILAEARHRLAHWMKLGIGNFLSDDFSSEELDLIYYLAVSK